MHGRNELEEKNKPKWKLFVEQVRLRRYVPGGVSRGADGTCYPPPLGALLSPTSGAQAPQPTSGCGLPAAQHGDTGGQALRAASSRSKAGFPRSTTLAPRPLLRPRTTPRSP